MRKRRETQKKLPFLPSFYRWLPMRQVHRSSVDYRPILPDGRHCSQYHWLIWETNKALLTLLKCFANTPHALAKIRPRPVQNVFSISSQHSYSKGDRAELIQISDLKLFPIKGAPCEGNETCFLYKGVSYLRVLTVVIEMQSTSKTYGLFVDFEPDVATESRLEDEEDMVL